jgi:hypothetical protein
MVFLMRILATILPTSKRLGAEQQLYVDHDQNGICAICVHLWLPKSASVRGG